MLFFTPIILFRLFFNPGGELAYGNEKKGWGTCAVRESRGPYYFLLYPFFAVGPSKSRPVEDGEKGGTRILFPGMNMTVVANFSPNRSRHREGERGGKAGQGNATNLFL